MASNLEILAKILDNRNTTESRLKHGVTDGELIARALLLLADAVADGMDEIQRQIAQKGD